MGHDDPGTDAGARPAPGGLWSYDGGWTSPAGDGPAPAEPPARRVRRTVPAGNDPGVTSADDEPPFGRAVVRGRSAAPEAETSVGEPAARRSRRGADRDGSGPARGRGGRRGSRVEDGAAGRAEEPPGDPEAVARAVCLRLLTLQPRTRSELAAALARRGVPDEAAETVLSRFTEVGLIDDRAFAAAWVDSRHAGRGLARRALAAELRRRGIDGEVVGEAVAVVDAEAEERAARQLVARRLAATRRLDQPARIRRLAGMLARKGYPPGLALSVVRDALAAEGTDPGDLDTLDDTVPDD